MKIAEYTFKEAIAYVARNKFYNRVDLQMQLAKFYDLDARESCNLVSTILKLCPDLNKTVYGKKSPPPIVYK